MPKLNVCGECQRHVYVEETACPFCGSTAARSFAIAPRSERLSRAAGYAARAVLLAGAVSSCSQSTRQADDASTQDSSAVDARADDASRADDAGADASVADTSVPDDAGVPNDGNPDDTDVPTPLYGGPFPDPRTRAVV